MSYDYEKEEFKATVDVILNDPPFIKWNLITIKGYLINI